VHHVAVLDIGRHRLSSDENLQDEGNFEWLERRVDDFVVRVRPVVADRRPSLQKTGRIGADVETTIQNVLSAVL